MCDSLRAFLSYCAKGTGGNEVNASFACEIPRDLITSQNGAIIRARGQTSTLNGARIHRLWHADRELRGEPA